MKHTEPPALGSVDALAARLSNRYMILFIGFIATIVVLIAAVGAAFTLRENTRRDWADEMSNLSLILAEHASQTLFSAHTVLNGLYDVVMEQKPETEEDFRSFVSRESSYQLLVDKTNANPIIDVATFVGGNGEVFNFSRSYPPSPINLSDRDYFLAHSANPNLGTYTSDPVHNKGTGTWVFYVSRRVDNSRGEMLGLVLVGVSVEVFSRFYENVAKDLGTGASLSLYRDDFTQMTRWPFAEDLVGKQNLTSATHHAIADQGKTSDVVFTNTARLTERNITQARISAPRVVERYPFIVTPVISEEHYLRSWRVTLWWIAGLTLLSLGLLGWGVHWLLQANHEVESELLERQRAQARFEHLAYHDALTALPNRRLLSDQLQRCIAACARSPVNCGLLFLDLDNFKEINDTHGHDQGDLLLQEVASRLVACVREDDTVARVGGDEFAILLNKLDPDTVLAAAKADGIATKITHSLAQPIHVGDTRYHTTVSMGLVLFGLTPASVEDLFKHADIAMYQAKTAGKNTHQFFDARMQQQVDERTTLVASLRQALANKELALHYQPQVHAGGRLLGAEALLRWNCPGRGAVPPARFVPLAEQTGLIKPLGNWVLETACNTLARWAGMADLAQLTLAVNVSSQQFKMPDFVDTVLGALQRSGARADRLKLELTESILAHDLSDVRAKMSMLRKHGVLFALDDFGTGYSSLSYLRELSIDQLKIDYSFVRDVMDDPNDATIVRAITNLGISLGMDVIAEGVETPAQRDFLISIHCLAFQGYLYSRPLPEKDFEQFAVDFMNVTS